MDSNYIDFGARVTHRVVAFMDSECISSVEMAERLDMHRNTFSRRLEVKQWTTTELDKLYHLGVLYPGVLSVSKVSKAKRVKGRK